MKKDYLKPLAEQVIVITGASSGIGLATAKLAAMKGAKVVLASRNLKALNKIVKDINAEGGEALAVKCDVSKLDQVQSLCDKTIAEFGKINTWVNNAGVSIYGKLVDLELSEEKQLFEINFWGIRNGCRVAFEALRAEGGVIINLGSEVSERPIPLQGIYSASKHAVKAYTDAFRMELEHDKEIVHLTLIRPTAINTPAAEHAANRLKKGIPKLPDTVYDPELVAESILKCAEAPQRDVFVGATSKFTQILESISPRLADNQLERNGFETQKKPRGKNFKESEALLRPPRAEGKVHGPNSDKERTSNIYTTLATHPVSTGIITTVLGAGLTALSKMLMEKTK